MAMLHKPVQMIFSFESFINDQFDPLLSSAFDGILAKGYRRPAYDLTRFEERVRERLADLKALGIGGVVVNYDYSDDYLEGEAGWHCFLTGLRAAADLGLRIWIFDEKGYPSGTAGGKVLEGHPELEAVGLKHCSIDAPPTSTTITLPDPRATLYATYATYPDGTRTRSSGKTGDRTLEWPEGPVQRLDVYFLAPLFEGTFAAAAGRRRYINVLDRRAVNRFLQVTHVEYFKGIPDDLRPYVEAFFTDEVALQAHAWEPAKPAFQQDPVDMSLPVYPSVPWSDELEDRFLHEHAYALQKHVPSLFDGFGEDDRKVRRDFWTTVSRLYVSAYARQASDVCAALGIDTSGHLLGEDTILQQVILHADLIQTLKAFHRPGIDLLSCRLEGFPNLVLTHKTALSASFFGSGKGVMSETSDYFESWSVDNKVLLPPDEIKCILALQYLLGVRDFCFMFKLDRFPHEVYRDVCAFTARLVELGNGCTYRPECGLYYPIEKLWEEYVPTYPCGDVCSAGTFGRTVGEGSAALQALNRLTTETANRLFYSNIQYVLCERPDVAHLPDRGIKTLAYYGPNHPDPDLNNLCQDVGINLVMLEDFEKTRPQDKGIQTGPHVLYATYDRFVFAVNTGREPSSITIPANANAIFPLTATDRQNVQGQTNLPPLACAFFFRDLQQEGG